MADAADAAVRRGLEARRRAAACVIVVCLLLVLVTEPFVDAAARKESASSDSVSETSGGIPRWLSEAAIAPFEVPNAIATRVEAALKGAKAVGFAQDVPPQNLTSFFRGMWKAPSASHPLRDIPRSNTTLLTAIMAPWQPNKRLLTASGGSLHMTLSSAPSKLPGIHHVAAAVRIVNGDGSASASDVFLTPITGLHVASTGEVAMASSSVSPAIVLVDTAGSCPAKGCNLSVAVAKAREAGMRIPNPLPPGTGNTTSNATASPARRRAEQQRMPKQPKHKQPKQAQGSILPTGSHVPSGRRSLAREPGVFVFSLPPTRAAGACSVSFSGRILPQDAISRIAKSGVVVDTSSAEKRTSQRRQLAETSEEDMELAPSLTEELHDQGAMVSASRHGWAAVLSRLFEAAATTAVPTPRGAELEPVASQPRAARGATTTQGPAAAPEPSLLQHSAATGAAPARHNDSPDPVLATQEDNQGPPKPPTVPLPPRLSPGAVLSALGALVHPPAPAATQDDARGEAEEHHAPITASSAPSNSLAPRGGGITPAGFPRGRATTATTDTVSKAAAETAAESRLAKAMGFDSDFKAPGTGLVGRYFASGRDELSPQVLVIRGVLSSPDCGFAANATAASVVFNRDAMLRGGLVYSILMLAFTGAHFAMTVRVIIDSLNTQIIASRASVLSIAMGTALDAWLSIAHSVVALAWSELMGGFALLAIGGLVLFSMLEVRLMLSVLKAHAPERFDGLDGMRRAVSLLYGRFYACLIGLVAIIVLVPNSTYPVIFLLCSFWVPQIARNAMLGAADSFSARYIATSTIARAFPVLYVIGCPSSFAIAMGLKMYDPAMGGVLALWIGLQLLVLYLQRHWGAQFLVPTALLPQKYDYHRPVHISDGRIVPGGGFAGEEEGDGGGRPAQPAADETRLSAMMAGAAASWRVIRRRMQRFPLWRFGPVAPRYVPLPQLDEGDAATSGAAQRPFQGAERARRTDVEAGDDHPGARLTPELQQLLLDRAAASSSETSSGTTGEASEAAAAEGVTSSEPGGDDSDPARNPDCVVCMMPVELPAAASTYMVTPCNHIFHSDCLKQWFEVKLQCPTCRATVPEP